MRRTLLGLVSIVALVAGWLLITASAATIVGHRGAVWLGSCGVFLLTALNGWSATRKFLWGGLLTLFDAPDHPPARPPE